MPTQKLGRLLGLTLMLVALVVGVVDVAGTPATGGVTTLEFEWA
ncbi:hypothetical protein [Micromonospora sp. RTP1Z1]|nr:hypothetical protein [Micromonospora sp. RTP1Z1]